MERLVQIGAQILEERGDQRQVGVAVQVAGADEQGPDADAVQGAGGVRAHPALATSVRNSAWALLRASERVTDLPQPCRVVVPGGQVLEQFDGADRRLDLAHGEWRLLGQSAPYRQQFPADQHDRARAETPIANQRSRFWSRCRLSTWESR